jgi:O-antigen/teichoic acid export membrane protein
MGFVMSVVVARLLGSESFGRFGIISGTLATFTVVATMGMGVAATKLVAQNRSKDPDCAGRSLVSALFASLIAGAVMALALAVSAPWLAANVLHDATLTTALRLSAVALFFTAWASAQAGGLGGIEAFSDAARVSMLGGFITFAFSLAGVWWWGFLGAIAALPVAGACQCLIQEVVLRRALAKAGVPYSYRNPFAEARMTLAVGVPAMLSSAVFVPATWLGSVILVRNAGYQHMAAFTIAEQWFNLVLMLPVVLGGVLLPVMTQVFSVSDHVASRSLLRKTLLLNAGLSALMMVAVAPFGFIILRLYGPTYPAWWPVFSVMVVAGCFLSAMAPIGHTLTATGRMWLGSAMNLGWSLAYLTGAYLLVSVAGKGALGLAWARLLAYGVHAIWSLLYLRSVMRHGSKGLAIKM